jgi:hypothetical protein
VILNRRLQIPVALKWSDSLLTSGPVGKVGLLFFVPTSNLTIAEVLQG